MRDNHLKEYDEYELLMLAMGRCAQDDYYLVPINEKELPEEITRRFSKRIEDVLPLENHCLLVFFRDGAVKKCDLQKHFEKTKAFQILLKKPDYFQHVQMQTGGYGVAWDVNMTVSDCHCHQPVDGKQRDHQKKQTAFGLSNRSNSLFPFHKNASLLSEKRFPPKSIHFI